MQPTTEASVLDLNVEVSGSEIFTEAFVLGSHTRASTRETFATGDPT